MTLTILEICQVSNSLLRLDMKKSLGIGVKHTLDYCEHCSMSFNEYTIYKSISVMCIYYLLNKEN